MCAILFLSIIFLHKFIDGQLASNTSDIWQLVWQDEFNGPKIDQTKWNFELGDGSEQGLTNWGNDEKQWYTNNEANAFVSDGKLIIQAQHVNDKYTSARMITKGKGDWKFGKIEIKTKFPTGEGLLPDIWLLPTYSRYDLWPASGSIDIAVRFGEKTGRFLSMIAHYGGVYPDHKESRRDYTINYPLKPFTEEFYIYSLVWEENKIEWFVNNDKVHEFHNDASFPSKYIYPFNDKFYLTLSLAVGGRPVSGNLKETVFPQRFEFDYIRVYQKM